MPTLLNTHPDYLSDQGARPVLLRVQWTATERVDGTRFAPGTQYRIGLYRATGPGAWEPTPAGYAYSGEAGQGEVIYATPDDLSFENPLEYLRGWLPLLAEGVYWPKVEYYDGAVWQTLVGLNPVYGASGFPDDPVVILTRMRHAEVYRVREGFPTPPYLVGPRRLDVEALP